jgi:hypothetical protein
VTGAAGDWHLHGTVDTHLDALSERTAAVAERSERTANVAARSGRTDKPPRRRIA